MNVAPLENTLRLIQAQGGDHDFSDLDDVPILTKDEERYYVAFNMLAPSRQINNDRIRCIPFSEMAIYCKMFSIHDSQEFIYILQELDNEFVSLLNEKISNNTG